MKRCPACGSISPDDEVICGVCGGSIAGVLFETMDEIERDREADAERDMEKERSQFERVKIHTLLRGVIGVLVAGAVIAAGLLLLLNTSNALDAVYAVFTITIGFVVLVAVLGTGPLFRRRYSRI